MSVCRAAGRARLVSWAGVRPRAGGRIAGTTGIGKRTRKKDEIKTATLVVEIGAEMRAVLYFSTGGWECLEQQMSAHPALLTALKSRLREGLLGRTSASGSTPASQALTLERSSRRSPTCAREGAD